MEQFTLTTRQVDGGTVVGTLKAGRVKVAEFQSNTIANVEAEAREAAIAYRDSKRAAEVVETTQTFSL